MFARRERKRPWPFFFSGCLWGSLAHRKRIFGSKAVTQACFCKFLYNVNARFRWWPPAAMDRNDPKSELAAFSHTANLSGLAIGCIEADVCNTYSLRFITKYVSIRLAHFCTAPWCFADVLRSFWRSQLALRCLHSLFVGIFWVFFPGVFLFGSPPPLKMHSFANIGWIFQKQIRRDCSRLE